MGGPSGGAPAGQNQFSNIGSGMGQPAPQMGGLMNLFQNPQFQSMLMGALTGGPQRGNQIPPSGGPANQMMPPRSSMPTAPRVAPPVAGPTHAPPAMGGGFALPGVPAVAPPPPPQYQTPQPLLPPGPWKPTPVTNPGGGGPSKGLPPVNFQQQIKLREMQQNPDQYGPMAELIQRRKMLAGQ